MRKMLFLLAAGFALAATAQTNETVKLSVVSPVDYQVFQRQSKAEGKIIIECVLDTSARGTVTNLERLEAQLVGPAVEGNDSAGWKTLPFDNRVRRFRGELTAPAGGWYQVRVRLIASGTNAAEVIVAHVGVGEVFIVSGQSNSANYGEEKQRAKNPLVVSYGDGHWRPTADPEPGASGKGGSFLPAFGDAMAEKFQVPIGLASTGVGGTSVREWLPGGDAVAAPPDTGHNVICVGSNSFISTGELFQRIADTEKQLGASGFRAVLWHQGESDSHEAADRQISMATYRQYLQRVIESSRASAGWRVPWFVAQVSYHKPEDQGTPELRAAQKSLVTDGIALAGPNTDDLGPEFRQNNGKGIHFNAMGLQKHGKMWADLVGEWLEQQLAVKQ